MSQSEYNNTMAGSHKKGKDVKGKDVKDRASLEVSLIHARATHITGLAFFGAIGAVLVIHFGILGQGMGVFLLLLAAQQARKTAATFQSPPGTFRTTGDQVQLPTGLCKGPEIKVARSEIDHAYFLRKAIPWTQTGPVLVVEANDKAYCFPRDWFASDSDQCRVAAALCHVGRDNR